jgi:hypothetical protein
MFYTRIKPVHSSDSNCGIKVALVAVKGKHLLPLMRHLPCYSYSQYVLDRTPYKQTQITYIRHEPSYKQLEIKTNQCSSFHFRLFQLNDTENS